MLGLWAGTPFKDAVESSPGVPPVILPAQQLSDVPGHRVDSPFVLGPAQLVDQILGKTDRQLLRCGHTLVIPVIAQRSQPDRCASRPRARRRCAVITPVSRQPPGPPLLAYSLISAL